MSGSVVITGVGAVSALGRGVPFLASGLLEGRCGIGRLSLFAHRGHCQSAAEVPGPADPVHGLPPATVRRLSRPDRFALVAATEACAGAGLEPALRRATTLFVGATTGGMYETEDAYRRWCVGDTARLRASRVIGTPLATTAAAVSQALGIYGCQETVSTACSSSALAVALAADSIRRGRARIAVAIGTDGLCRLTYAGFDALRALDPDRCRPFDRDRRGLTLGEGAGALVMEDAAHAEARGAHVYARFLGYGTTSDAYHPTAPHPEGAGALAALRSALEAARLSAEAIDYVNAHGTGTPQNDVVEVGVLRAAFGARLGKIPVSSSKSQLGHCLGAAGALEAIVTVLALERGVVPPTIALREPDPAWADLDLVTEPGRRAPLATAITSSYGFGGHNVTLVLGRAEGA